MKKALLRQYGGTKPRALVLDDNARARTATCRRLKARGFDVVSASDIEEFQERWSPGCADVIVADWDLSTQDDVFGHSVLENIRQRDWEVPFVLVSGKLSEHLKRAQVLQSLLESGAAKYVARGDEGIERACIEAEKLLDRRDPLLLKMILAFRNLVSADASVKTTSGQRSVSEMLARLLRSPSASHIVEEPVSSARLMRVIKRPDE